MNGWNHLDLCGAVPALPRPFLWSGCGLHRHPLSVDHVSYQDGVTITWNEQRIEEFKRTFCIQRAPQ